MITLAKAVDDYLSLRRKLGYKLEDAGFLLKQFVSFMKNEHASFITTALALRWATQPTNVQSGRWSVRLRAVRIFAKHHHVFDSRTEVPPSGLLPYYKQRKKPYIYNASEIQQLVEAARRLSSRSPGLRPWTHSTLLGLLAVTGMRISEALTLDCDDVDLRGGVLTIRNTKFGKNRLVPIHPTTRTALQNYLRRRNQTFPKVETSSFFLSERGTRLKKAAAHRTFYELSHQIGLRRTSDHHGPCFHAMRHSFAVATMLCWYRKGVDVEQRMPVLSTYLGHGNTNATFWYISAVPELLHLAATRLDHSKGAISYDNVG